MNLPPITVYRTAEGLVAQRGEDCFLLAQVTFDDLFTQADAHGWLEPQLSYAKPVERPAELLAPIGSQEVWAAGVTYLRSRDARMEESKDGGSVYDRVYAAERPEIFFKATPHRVVGTGADVRIRQDSKWNVPEPEVALAINSAGRIFGYTIGNDMSSRDIEGENPLYLPQAKVYDGSCALGPGILVASGMLPRSTEIMLDIVRGERCAFAGCVKLSELKRDPRSLVEYLFRDNSFPSGCFLMTGTGIVPPSDFTLQAGDRVRITIEPIGTLENEVA